MVRAALSHLGIRSWLVFIQALVGLTLLFFVYVAVERLHFTELADSFKRERRAVLALASEASLEDVTPSFPTPWDDLLVIELPGGAARALMGHADPARIPMGFVQACAAADRLSERFVDGANGRLFLVCRPLSPMRRVLVGAWHTAPIEARRERFAQAVGMVGLIVFAFFLVFSDVLQGAIVIRPLKRLGRLVHRLWDDDEMEEGSRPLVRDLRLVAGAIDRMIQGMNEDRGRMDLQAAELKRIHRELEATRGHLVQSGKLATIGELSAGIAHEIGNPLGVIQGYVSILERGDLSDEERANILRTLDEAVRRIKRIVKDLLTFSRPTSDEPGSSDVGEVIRDLWRFVEGQKKFRSIKMDLQLAREPLPADIPASRLHQILMNLFLNASDAMGGQGHIEIRGYGRQGRVSLRVKDHGPGIPVDRLDSIFRPFYSTKGDRGTGLGLTISNYLTLQHGGELAVESVPGKGCTFVLSLREGDEEELEEGQALDAVSDLVMGRDGGEE